MLHMRLQWTLNAVGFLRPQWHDTQLKACSQQVTSYFRTTRQRIPYCIPDTPVRQAYQTYVYAEIVNNTQCTVLEDIGSDHRSTLFQITYRTMHPQHTRIWRWNYKEAHWIKFHEIADKHLQRLQLGKDSQRTTAKSVISSKALPGNPSHGVKVHKYSHRGLLDRRYSGIGNLMQPD